MIELKIGNLDLNPTRYLDVLLVLKLAYVLNQISNFFSKHFISLRTLTNFKIKQYEEYTTDRNPHLTWSQDG
jgi:hypothetical protein